MRFILCPVAALAAFARPGHILVYAPGDALTLPPCYRTNDFAQRFILCLVAVLVAFASPGHILVYAPRFFSVAALPQNT
ncbi:hypothetical protein AYY17_11935 [Morganella psychrotolerans]|uniref:Uncharacterized protein n=1 Tax=Morganella psychrotolerans TaxID=368603 RepID=A0A1B8H1R0_9GAMM|nr:hypothetical protein AYY17_11935 [Morganella psychrotolerans]